MTDRQGSAVGSGTAYQVMLVALLSVNFGIVFFDRNAPNFLMPFVQPELGLSNTQVGVLASALSLTGVRGACHRLRFRSHRQPQGLLIIATLAFSACSFLSGIAASFVAMLAARLLMGVAEGGVMPISQTLIAAEVKPEHRGLPRVSRRISARICSARLRRRCCWWRSLAYGWRHVLPRRHSRRACRVAHVALCAQAEVARAGNGGKRLTLREAFAERNVLLSTAIGVLLVSYLVVCWAFMPLYLTKVRQYSPGTMGWLMGTLGISATVGAFVVSGLSDRIGRRPLMILMPFVGVILPLGAMWFHGSVWVLAAIFFFGWGLNGIFPLFMATVPSESVDRAHTATVLGLCMGIPEVLGGVLAPSIAGYAADIAGLQAPLWIMLGLAIAAGCRARAQGDGAVAAARRRAVNFRRDVARMSHLPSSRRARRCRDRRAATAAARRSVPRTPSSSRVEPQIAVMNRGRCS
jgi:predicted MFS family arabinose efflux permease